MATQSRTPRSAFSVLGQARLFLLAFLQVTALSAGSAVDGPSEISAMNCLYRAIHGESGAGVQTACFQALSHYPNNPLAILRSDYRRDADGSASLWFELLSQAADDTTPQTKLYKSTFEWVLDAIEGGPVINATERLSSEPIDVTGQHQSLIINSQLKGLVYAWLQLLDQRMHPDPGAFARTPFIQAAVLTGEGKRLNTPELVSEWLLSRASQYPALQQHVEGIEIVRDTASRYQIRFSVNWRSEEEGKGWRVGRRLYRWDVLLDDKRVPQIQQIEEQNTLPQPNMGTRIFC